MSSRRRVSCNRQGHRRARTRTAARPSRTRTRGRRFDELRERTGDLTEDKRRAHAAAGQREQAIVDAGAAATADAETQAQRQQQAGRRRAEDEADAVARASAADAAGFDAEALSVERGAAQRHDHHEARAADAEHRAAQLRTEASNRGRS